jgi:hypothetical protein
LLLDAQIGDAADMTEFGNPSKPARGRQNASIRGKGGKPCLTR